MRRKKAKFDPASITQETILQCYELPPFRPGRTRARQAPGPPVFDRATMLAGLAIGDIVHASYANGAVRFCLVTGITNSTILTRAVTTRRAVAFDRPTGLEKTKDHEPAVIDSIAPLPLDVHNVLLGLDRKSRLERGERGQLDKAEIYAIGFARAHYRDSPLEPLSDAPATGKRVRSRAAHRR